jgi:hypothetical protein
MKPTTPDMDQITKWWQEFRGNTSSKDDLLATAIGEEVRKRIFEVREANDVIFLFDKLDMVIGFYLSLGKRIRSTEDWQEMLFWSLLSILLWADHTQLAAELEELDGAPAQNAIGAVSTFH